MDVVCLLLFWVVQHVTMHMVNKPFEVNELGSSPVQTPTGIIQSIPSEPCANRLRRSTRVLGEENANLKRKLAETARERQALANTAKAELLGGIEKARGVKLRDSLLVGASVERDILSEAQHDTAANGQTSAASAAKGWTTAADGGIDTEVAAIEWQWCISLLKSYGVVENIDHLRAHLFPQRAPHPGFVGDGLRPMMCKACGNIEDASNTVICDHCQEAFHLSCSFPRISPKYFSRKDNWFCNPCRKQKTTATQKKKKRGSKESNISKDGAGHKSSVRLGCDHQAQVPEWQERDKDDDVERCCVGCIGMEIALSQEQKDGEKDRLQKDFENVRAWADKLPSATKDNWVRCRNIVVRARTDSGGHKHRNVVCGKWRRAPPHVEQAHNWECFCAIEWDPSHADCAIPQELPK